MLNLSFIEAVDLLERMKQSQFYNFDHFFINDIYKKFNNILRKETQFYHVLRFGFKDVDLREFQTTYSASNCKRLITPSDHFTWLSIEKHNIRNLKPHVGPDRPNYIKNLDNLKSEELAIKIWSATHNNQYGVRKCMGMYNPIFPFLSASNDGWIVKNGQVISFIEVKTFEYLKSHSFDHWFNDNSINKRGISRKLLNGKYHYFINQFNNHYLQIQLNLAIANLEIAILIIFCKYENKIIEIPIHRNNNYLVIQLNKIKISFQKNMFNFYDMYKIKIE